MDTTSKNEYVTSRGYRLKFKAIPVLLQKVSGTLKPPQVPTYTPKVAEGFVAQPEPHYHRVVKVRETDDAGNETGREIEQVETSLETHEEWAAWREYENALGVYAANLLQAQLRACLMEGVEIVARPTRDWEKRQQMLGLEIPQDPDEKELYFLETEVIGSMDDAVAIIAGVSRTSGIDEEAVSTLEDSFRRAVGQGRAVDSANGHAQTHTAVAASDMARELAV